MIPFTPFPKVARLAKPCVVTEKIDGTNASITIIGPDDIRVCELEGAIWAADLQRGPYPPITAVTADNHYILVGSRKRWITPDDDNFGFARWVRDHANELVALGPGTHYGEWYGAGIQRSYGWTDKHFALFNVNRWEDPESRPGCCGVVPVIYRGLFDSETVELVAELLQATGSRVAAPGWKGEPEGVMVYLEAPRLYLKHPFDPAPKGQA